jgi:hypothetical protein
VSGAAASPEELGGTPIVLNHYTLGLTISTLNLDP